MPLVTRIVLIATISTVVATGTSSSRASESPSLRNGFGYHSDQSPSGANDWTCRPAEDHPNPVVLVHGTGANMAANWGYHAPRIADVGFCVFALTYGRVPDRPYPFNHQGGIIRMEESAAELNTFVHQVLEATGATKVDVVGHSQGSLMPNWWIRFGGGEGLVDRYVGLTPLWDGTNAGGYATFSMAAPASLVGITDSLMRAGCESCPQFFNGSDFIAQMNSDGGPAAPGVTYTMIMTRFDEAVVPYTSGFMDGATNIVVQDVCPGHPVEHIAMANDPVTNRLILNALDPDGAEPPSCGIGALRELLVG